MWFDLSPIEYRNNGNRDCDANFKERSVDKCSIIVCLCAIRGSIDRTIYMYFVFDLFYRIYLFFILPASPFTGQQIKRKWEEVKKMGNKKKRDIVQCNIIVILIFCFKDKSSLRKSNLAKRGLTPRFCPYYQFTTILRNGYTCWR